MNKLNSGFTRLSDKEFDNKVGQVLTAVTGNAAMGPVQASLPAIQTQLTAYQDALSMPDGVAKTAQVKATRDALSASLDQLARSIELIPGITEAQFATSGFDVRKQAGQTGEAPAAPANVRLKTTGVTGQVQFLFDPSDRARTYEIQTTIDPNTGNWTQAGMFSSTRGVVVAGLTRGKDVWGRVRAIGPNNTASGWSDPATVMVA
jgi:hypothetical protein